MSPRPKKRLPLHFKNSKRRLDCIPIIYIPISNHPTRGAFCRTLSNVGWRRRSRAGLVTPRSGGPGQPKAGGSPPDKGCDERAPCVPPGSTAPGTKKPHGGAPEGDAPLSKRRGSPQGERLVVAPFGAPPPRTLLARAKAPRTGAVSRAVKITHACAAGDCGLQMRERRKALVALDNLPVWQASA
jgi:hypothetical protein